MKFSKLIVSLIISLNVLFTIGVMYIFYRTGTEPITLIASFFAFTTGELWFMATIKKKEIGDGEDEY